MSLFESPRVSEPRFTTRFGTIGFFPKARQGILWAFWGLGLSGFRRGSAQGASTSPCSLGRIPRDLLTSLSAQAQLSTLRSARRQDDSDRPHRADSTFQHCISMWDVPALRVRLGPNWHLRSDSHTSAPHRPEDSSVILNLKPSHAKHNFAAKRMRIRATLLHKPLKIAMMYCGVVWLWISIRRCAYSAHRRSTRASPKSSPPPL